MAPDRATAAEPFFEPPPPRERRTTPPLWFWLLVIVVGVLNVGAQWPDLLDHAFAKIVLAASVFIVLMALLIWLAFGSDYSLALRIAPLVVVLGVMALAAATMRIERVAGELGPEFRWRWAKHPDQLLPAVNASSLASVPLDQTTEHDFPQFLGPHRSAAVDDVRLGRDWKTPPRKLWSAPIGAGHSGFAIVNGYGVTMEQRDIDELITCYDIVTGDLKWSHATNNRHSSILGGTGPRSTPTIDEGKVYALGATGILNCLDGRNGKQLWSKDLMKECGTNAEEESNAVYWGRAGSPLVVDDLVIVPGGGPANGPWISLLAYDKTTGKLMWQAGSHQISYSSPALAVLGTVRQVLIVNQDNISAHDPRTGEILWERAWPGSSTSSANSSQVVSVGGDRCFVSKGYTGGSSLFAVKRDEKGNWSTETLWHNSRLLLTKFTNVVIRSGFVYGLSDGILECVELETGKRRWKEGRYGHGQILRVGDLLLVSTELGEIVLLELSSDGRRELGQFQALEGQTWNNPSLFGRYLLVRNSDEAACYELPLERPGK